MSHNVLALHPMQHKSSSSTKNSEFLLKEAACTIIMSGLDMADHTADSREEVEMQQRSCMNSRLVGLTPIRMRKVDSDDHIEAVCSLSEVQI